MRAGALGRAVGMGVVTRRVLAAPVVCAAAAEGRGAVREVAGAGRKGAIAAPERHYLPNCKQASLLTKTSWGSGQSST